MRNLLGISILVLIATLLVLSGCLGKMEKIAEDTKGHVHESNDLIRETHNAQVVGGALNLVADKAKPFHMRVTSAETVILTAREDRLIKYLGGAPGDFKKPETYRPLESSVVALPNVTWVAKDPKTLTASELQDSLGITAIEEDDLFVVWHTCLTGLTTQLFLKSRTLAELSEEQKAEFKKQLERVLHATTIVAGAIPVHHARKVADDRRNREFVIPSDVRALIALRLREAHRNAGISENEERTLKQLIETRLGIAQE